MPGPDRTLMVVVAQSWVVGPVPVEGTVVAGAVVAATLGATLGADVPPRVRYCSKAQPVVPL